MNDDTINIRDIQHYLEMFDNEGRTPRGCVS